MHICSPGKYELGHKELDWDSEDLVQFLALAESSNVFQTKSLNVSVPQILICKTGIKLLPFFHPLSI